MSEFHVEVTKLKNVQKHPNADTLSIGEVNGYPVIFKNGDFAENDLVVHIPVDSIVPDTEDWAFLSGHLRIKAKKLRGIFSMGLIIKPKPEWKCGKNVQKELNITKWEPQPEVVSHKKPKTFWGKLWYRVKKALGLLAVHGENETDPGFLPVYTDIEGWRRYKDIIQDGEEVVLTEKTHGCLKHDTRIIMVDGSKKPISQIKDNDIVLGVDDCGRVVPSTVLKVFDNGKAEKWLKITGTRRCAGKGNSYFAVTCTPEHKFWNPTEQKYVEASSLKIKDPVSIMRTDLMITPIQEQVMLGKLLGDGYLRDTKWSAAIEWGHKKEHDEYSKWTLKALGDLASSSLQERVSGYGTEMVVRSTVATHWIQQKFKPFYSTGKKTVPDWVADKLSPISMAFWYMDDGSLSFQKDQEDRACFAVCAFTKQDCNVLVRGLSRFGINAVYSVTEGSHSRLRLNADDAERLFLLIAPYVPPVMQYKLPKRYRGSQGWLPQDVGKQYKSTIITQEVLSIEDVTDSTVSSRYDLETSTHNYFANGVLVHNCNSRYLYRDGRLWVGSHRQIKRRDKSSVFWKAAIDLNLEEKLKKYPNIAVYGEIFGQVQDLKYGMPNSVKLVLFDAQDTIARQYLDYDEFKKLAADLDLPTVPELYRGPWSRELLKLAEGKTTFPGADHVREGFVVKPTKERFDAVIGRVILKMVGEGYLLRKSQ